MADATTSQHWPNVTIDSRLADKPDGTPGDPAPVESGSVVWATSDATVLSLLVAPDGMSADVSTVAPGTARITVTADADLGAGVVEIIGISEDVNVTQDPASMASVIRFTFGAPVAK